MKFLNKLISEVLSTSQELSNHSFILPGKRPAIFIKKILTEQGYEGILPAFQTIEEMIEEISGKTLIPNLPLWLFAYDIYQKKIEGEPFDAFIKWFPTLLKDWDDIMKFAPNDTKVLEYMLDEERIKNWGESLGDDTARRKNLNFWKKMNQFLPELKQALLKENLATSGMIHQLATQNISSFAEKTAKRFVFIGFNAFTPVEELLVKSLLREDKALCFFQADDYYMNDEKQEAGAFLRRHKQWKEFNDYRPFRWVENDFIKQKKIKVYEAPGNISQTKALPLIFNEIEDKDQTALILLDENLLPATLDSLSSIERINITMGFPLKNLEFSNAIRQIFYIQKQLAKNPKSYYYNDIVSVLENLPSTDADKDTADRFIRELKEKNMVYISEAKLRERLSGLSYFSLFEKTENAKDLLDKLSDFCFQLKFNITDDIVFENISHFEKSFKIIRNLIDDYHFEIRTESLEVLINQVIANESLDFQGEPLGGLQIMGLLETRLLNFKNIILLSVNEGKLPLGNTQNTYIPYDIRKKFGMHTFLENDSIYAYHFYRLLQDSERVFLLYNGLSSGINTGEKSRFITQIELESPHEIEEVIIENQSAPIIEKPIRIEKTAKVLEALEAWKSKVSPTHLTSYLYDPVQFYLNYVLKTRETAEIEEELSQRNYGNIIHKSLEYLYKPIVGKLLSTQDLEAMLAKTEEALEHTITQELKHQPEYYQKGMNYIHKSLAQKVIKKVIHYDLSLVEAGNSLEIIDIETRIENITFPINDEGDSISFFGFIDRLDRLNGSIRLIDYKTAKPQNLNITFKDNRETLLMEDKYKQTIQLCVYLYYLRQSEFSGQPAQAGIWSFAEVGKGVHPLSFQDGDLDTAMISIRTLINEILNPEIPFIETEKQKW